MKPTAISLFTGAMGLDLGFERENFDVKVSVEKDKWAVKVMEARRPSVPVMAKDIKDVSTEEILEKAGLSVGEATVVIGAPPCEPFSTAGRRNGFLDERALPVRQFIRVVREARPRAFVMEEVQGFLWAAKRHISFYERVKKSSEELEREPDLRLGSAFEEVIAEFADLGYSLNYDEKHPKVSVLNAADFGVPQKRKRFILIGVREGPPVPLPRPTHAQLKSLEVAKGTKRPWVTLGVALKKLNDPEPEHSKFPTPWSHYLEHVPPGGCWRDLPVEMHREALGGAYDDPNNLLTAGLKGGRTGFLRRLSWDAPSPTLVDRPTTRAGCMAHPDQWWRPLSVKEYALLQGFPEDWVPSEVPLAAKYRLIGQATPVGLARAIAKAIVHYCADGKPVGAKRPPAQ